MERSSGQLLTSWSESLRADFGNRAAKISAMDGDCLFSPGSAAESFLVVLNGTVRLEQTSSSGRSIVIYRVEAGQSCVMTTSCLLSGTPYSSFGYAEGNVEAYALGQNSFKSLLQDSPEFMASVFGVFSGRLVELTNVIDELLLHRVDQKLGHWLARQGSHGTIISTTHQLIAHELGTVREVVSRTLKDFERKGWISLSRGSTTLLDTHALEKLGKSN